MSIAIARIEERLRERICPRCARFTADRRCSLPRGRMCAIFRHLPGVIDVVRRTRSTMLSPYAESLRLNVCSACPHEDDHGSCPMRSDIDCALDSYLALVVDEIEEELAREARERASSR